jgi:RecA/RadA recombinase
MEITAREKMLKFLEKTNTRLKKIYGADTFYLASEAGNYKPFYTGFPTFDNINSGIGGFPRGGFTLVHGLESTGKSTFVLEAIKYAQIDNPDLNILYIDVESALTDQFLKFKGINPVGFALSPLNACEDVLTVAKDAIQENVYDMIILDSLAKLDSKKILEKDIGDPSQRNRRAVLITEFLRSISFTLRKSVTALIAINQLVQNQDITPFAPKFILPGGMQQKYSANLIIEMKRIKSIKDGEKKAGYVATLKSTKNKISNKENAVTTLTYLFDRGFIREIALVDYLVAIGYVRKLTAGRFEFEKKELHSEVFKVRDMASIAKKIKDSFGIDLYKVEPATEIEFEKDEATDDTVTEEMIISDGA